MSRSAALPPCVVVGLEQNGLGVVRALGRDGVPAIAITDARKRSQTATRYARTVLCRDLRDESLLDTLASVAAECTDRPVLVATMDRTVNLLADHRPKVDALFRHSMPTVPVTRMLMSKAETDGFARQHGFLVPRTFAVNTEEAVGGAADQVGFPCILKPQVKTVAFVERAPKKAFLIEGRDELLRTFNMVSQWEPDMVVQEWIAGPDTNLVFCMYYFNDACEPLAWFGGRKIRQYIPYCGTACAAEPWRDDHARDEGIRFFQAAGYRGFGAIEFKIDSAGRYHLIEPTIGRTEHIFALAAANGVNLPAVGYRDMAGLPQRPAAPVRSARVYVDWKRDLKAARYYIGKGELTWGSYLKSTLRPQQHALFAWDDPGPIARHATFRATRAAGALGRRIGLGSTEVPSSGASVVTSAGELTNLRIHAEAAIDWICRAQDATIDGGVSRAYGISVQSGHPIGWQPSYPETTGYIIPTFYECATRWQRPDLADRARRMTDWLLTVQLPSGGFPGSTIDKQAPAVVFNTGMILQGLCRTFRETHEPRYLDAIRRAVQFLTANQSPDGAWRSHTTVSGEPLVHCYDLLVCTAMLEAAEWLDRSAIVAAVRRNLDFSLTLQNANGWLRENGIRRSHHPNPPTHTLGYASAGWLECGRVLNDPRYVDAARRVATSLMAHLRPDGWMTGQFSERWEPVGDWCCLTGNAQMAIVWRTLAELDGNAEFAGAARRAVGFVARRQLRNHDDPGVRGGVAGSSPIEGHYGRYQYLNWAAKFFVDALLLEEQAAQR